MKVFSKKKFIKTMGEQIYKFVSAKDELNWIDMLNGKEVVNETIEYMRRKI